jgi:hypothetical protein
MASLPALVQPRCAAIQPKLRLERTQQLRIAQGWQHGLPCQRRRHPRPPPLLKGVAAAAAAADSGGGLVRQAVEADSIIDPDGTVHAQPQSGEEQRQLWASAIKLPMYSVGWAPILVRGRGLPCMHVGHL